MSYLHNVQPSLARSIECRILQLLQPKQYILTSKMTFKQAHFSLDWHILGSVCLAQSNLIVIIKASWPCRSSSILLCAKWIHGRFELTCQWPCYAILGFIGVILEAPVIRCSITKPHLHITENLTYKYLFLDYFAIL